MSTTKQATNTQNKNYRYKTSVFFICLVISASVWLLTKFAYNFPAEINVTVSYAGIPQGQILVNNADSIMKLNIRASGFKLFRFKYFRSKRTYEINLENYRLQKQGDFSELVLGSMTVAQQIVDKYNLPGTVEFVVPETLILRFEKEESKTVPVIPDIGYTLMKQHFAYDSLKVEPKEVKISGTAEAISKVFFIKTKPLKFDNLSTSIDQMTGFEIPKNANQIQVDPTHARISLPIEKFTEAEIEIPIKQVHAKNGLRVKLFPEKAKVVYMVALKDYKRIDAEKFSCVVNLANVGQTTEKRLSLEIQSQPDIVKIVRIVPPDVEFIILK